MDNRMQTKTITSNEGGFALISSLLAIVLLTVFATGGFMIGHQEQRIGISNENATEAFYLAERGVADLMANWDPRSFSHMGNWTTRTVADTLGEGIWEVGITRMSSKMYLLDASGTVTRGGTELAGATRRIGLIARTMAVSIDPPAALTTQDSVIIAGTAEVDGYDVHPPGWGGACVDPLADKPGVMTDSLGTVTTIGSGQVDGDPPHEPSSTVGDSTFTQFGDLDYNELVDLATGTMVGGTFSGMGPSLNADGTCNTNDPMNWGDPTDPNAPCGNYFPTIHIEGTAKIQGGGMGQGILLVDGDLDLRGGFQFHGVVIVQGTFETQGNGNKVLGGVYARNAVFDDQKLVGDSVVQTSSCAVSRSLLHNQALAVPRLLSERSWIDLSSVLESG